MMENSLFLSYFFSLYFVTELLYAKSLSCAFFHCLITVTVTYGSNHPGAWEALDYAYVRNQPTQPSVYTFIQYRARYFSSVSSLPAIG